METICREQRELKTARLSALQLKLPKCKKTRTSPKDTAQTCDELNEEIAIEKSSLERVDLLIYFKRDPEGGSLSSVHTVALDCRTLKLQSTYTSVTVHGEKLDIGATVLEGAALRFSDERLEVDTPRLKYRVALFAGSVVIGSRQDLMIETKGNEVLTWLVQKPTAAGLVAALANPSLSARLKGNRLVRYSNKIGLASESIFGFVPADTGVTEADGTELSAEDIDLQTNILAFLYPRGSLPDPSETGDLSWVSRFEVVYGKQYDYRKVFALLQSASSK